MDYKYFDVRGTYIETSRLDFGLQNLDKMSLSAVSAWNKKYTDILQKDLGLELQNNFRNFVIGERVKVSA